MHRWMMENVQKIKIKLENIWIDLIRGIYAPYRVIGAIWTIFAMSWTLLDPIGPFGYPLDIPWYWTVGWTLLLCILLYLFLFAQYLHGT